MQKVAIGAGFTTAMIVAPALVHHAVRGELDRQSWQGHGGGAAYRSSPGPCQWSI